MLIADLPFLPVQLVPEAEAIFGVRRRAWRRGVVVGSTVAAASRSAAVYHQQAAPPPAAGRSRSTGRTTAGDCRTCPGTHR